MIDSLEKLAQSRTFAMLNGQISEVDEPLTDQKAEGAFEPGTLVDAKYKILALIGSGGMGAIYKTHHVLLNKEVALKTFLSRKFDDNALQRFRREVQAIAKLKHKNIIEIFDFGEVQGKLPYYTMELLAGRSLADKLKEHGRPVPDQTLKIFLQVAEGLAHAHRQNIVHRDIKPANIILVAAQTAGELPLVKIVDFGLAKLLAGGSTREDQSLTSAGTIFGSPLYMSPEQSLGMDTDQRTDMYSFGCALYESLAGSPPFVGDTAFQTLMKHQSEKPPALTAKNAGFVPPARLEAMLQKLLEKKPQNRYENFDQIASDLSLCLENLGTELKASGQKRAASAAPHESAEDAVETSYQNARAPSKVKQFMVALVFVAVGLAIAVPALNKKTKAAIVPPVLSSGEIPAKVAPGPGLDGGSYFQGYTRDGAMKIFRFPADLDLGALSTQENSKQINCKGEVRMPAAQHIILNLSASAQDHPQLLRRFGDHNLWGVKTESIFSTTLTLSATMMEEICNIPGLRSLDISDEKLAPNSFRFIDNCKTLSRLEVGNTNITAEELASLKILPALDSLGLTGMEGNLTPIWRALLAANARLKILVVNEYKLTDNDFATIGRLPNLQYFSDTNSSTDPYQLGLLAPAAHLVQLNWKHNLIRPTQIKCLAHFKVLRSINLTMKNLTATERTALRTTLPSTCSIYEEAKYLPMVVPLDY